MDFVIYKAEADNQGRLVELVHNKHCEVYEVIVDGIPVFNCTDYQIAEHEYNMECVQVIWFALVIGFFLGLIGVLNEREI